MFIGIDGNEANVENRVGISEYAFALLSQFNKETIGESSQKLQYQIYLKDSPLGHMPKEKDENWHYRIVGPRKLWTQFGLPLDLYTHKPRPNVFFSPTHYAPRFSPIPTAISIMDLSYIHYPYLFRQSDLYQLRNWTAYSARQATKIFTISNASKDDIIKVYDVPSHKVVVTYPGIKFKTKMSKLKTTVQNSKVLKKYGVSGDYILFVGTLQPRKNITRLIEAFAKIHHQNKSLQLVVVGKKGWLYEEILEAPKQYHIEAQVKFLEFVPDEDLSVLYQQAICFVLPSLYEGFGLPVLEAMSHGCPVITSSTSSLPEAGGEAALYVDPTDVDDIASKMSLLIKDEKLKKELREKGYKQVKKFSWEKTARETLTVLEQVGKGIL